MNWIDRKIEIKKKIHNKLQSKNSTNLWAVRFVHIFRCSLSPAFRTSLAIKCCISVWLFASLSSEKRGNDLYLSFVINGKTYGILIADSKLQHTVFTKLFSAISSLFSLQFFNIDISLIKSSMHICSMHACTMCTSGQEFEWVESASANIYTYSPQWDRFLPVDLVSSVFWCAHTDAAHTLIRKPNILTEEISIRKLQEKNKWRRRRKKERKKNRKEHKTQWSDDEDSDSVEFSWMEEGTGARIQERRKSPREQWRRNGNEIFILFEIAQT